MNKPIIQNKKPEDALLIRKDNPQVNQEVITKAKVVEKKEQESREEVTGINLIPNLSKEEIVQETKKKTLNMSAVISLMILVVVSILVVGFNIISKIQLNSEKDKLYNYEKRIENSSSKIKGNTEIKERIELYKNIQKNAFSPRTVIEYINKIAVKSGSITISNFEFGNQLAFELKGEAYNFEDVSKFWYLLSNDSKVETVSLDSVGKSLDGVRFNFRGKLVFTDFTSSI